MLKITARIWYVIGVIVSSAACFVMALQRLCHWSRCQHSMLMKKWRKLWVNVIACGADLCFIADVLLIFLFSARSLISIGQAPWNFTRWLVVGRVL